MVYIIMDCSLLWPAATRGQVCNNHMCTPQLRKNVPVWHIWIYIRAIRSHLQHGLYRIHWGEPFLQRCVLEEPRDVCTGGDRAYKAVYLKSHEMYALGEPCLQSCVLEEPRDVCTGGGPCLQSRVLEEPRDVCTRGTVPTKLCT